MIILRNTLYFGLALIGFAAVPKVVASNQNVKNNLSVLRAGLHIESSDIKYRFSRHLVKFIGDCPGANWSGIAETGDIRFIDQKINPAKKLKVDLFNHKTGRKITRKYYKPKLGSNDFNLPQLGNSDGEHNVDYTIYHRETKEVISQGSFIYIVKSTSETKRRQAEWKRELYCASDRNDKISDCKKVAARDVKYCGGKKTGITREDYTYKHPKKKCP